MELNPHDSSCSNSNISKIKKSPNSPLIKSPYLKIKVEGRNLEKAVTEIPEHLQSMDASLESLQSLQKYAISLEPYANLIINDHTKITKAIFHNSPKWLDEFEFEINNNKTDRLIIEIYTRSLSVLSESKTGQIKINSNSDSNHASSNGIFLKNTLTDSSHFLGFQILPIKFIEKFGNIGEVNTIWIRLINRRQEDYFVKDNRHALNIDNHDPINYKIDEGLANRDIGVPLLKITYHYFDFYNLWLINCSVHTIIQRETGGNKSKYIYRLFIKRNDDLEWFKEKTFEEIEKFRNYLKKYIEEVKNLPFPKRSIFSFLPLVGSYYSEDNNDVLIENKFILDNFFEQICANPNTYKLEEFNSFFAEDESN
jgi:hypothetical protein